MCKDEINTPPLKENQKYKISNQERKCAIKHECCRKILVFHGLAKSCVQGVAICCERQDLWIAVDTQRLSLAIPTLLYFLIIFDIGSHSIVISQFGWGLLQQLSKL